VHPWMMEELVKAQRKELLTRAERASRAAGPPRRAPFGLRHGLRIHRRRTVEFD
jgi:hypothetical protein